MGARHTWADELLRAPYETHAQAEVLELVFKALVGLCPNRDSRTSTNDTSMATMVQTLTEASRHLACLIHSSFLLLVLTIAFPCACPWSCCCSRNLETMMLIVRKTIIYLNKDDNFPLCFLSFGVGSSYARLLSPTGCPAAGASTWLALLPCCAGCVETTWPALS